jgi:nitrile hydratase
VDGIHDLGGLHGFGAVRREDGEPVFHAPWEGRTVGELGFGGAEGEHITVVENTDRVHHVVVCTLCSCYPWPVLGLPPRWYKSFAYRARMVREPRAVLAEFGITDFPQRTGVH